MGMKAWKNNEGHKVIFKRFLVAFIVLVVVILFGTLGYHFIEGWSFSDAAYMTVITIASVGYGEVRDLSGVGRIFTSFLIFIGVVTIAGWVGIMTSLFVDTDLKNYFRRKKMIGKIQNMRNHTIICGGGDTGMAVIHELYNQPAGIVLVENDPEAVKYVQYIYPKVAIVESNATVEEALWIANIKVAKNLVVSLSSDIDDIYVVLTARDLNPNLFIVAKAFDDSKAKRILKAGANEVVSPNKIGGQRMAQLCCSGELQASA